MDAISRLAAGMRKVVDGERIKYPFGRYPPVETAA